MHAIRITKKELTIIENKENKENNQKKHKNISLMWLFYACCLKLLCSLLFAPCLSIFFVYPCASVGAVDGICEHSLVIVVKNAYYCLNIHTKLIKIDPTLLQKY